MKIFQNDQLSSQTTEQGFFLKLFYQNMLCKYVGMYGLVGIIIFKFLQFLKTTES